MVTSTKETKGNKHMKKVTIKYKGRSVDCYGKINTNNMVDVISEYGRAGRVSISPEVNTWTKLVHILIDTGYYPSLIKLK